MMDNQVAKELGFSFFIILAVLVIFPLFIFSIPIFIMLRIFKSKKFNSFILGLSLVVFVFMMIYDYQSFFGMYILLPYVESFLVNVLEINVHLTIKSYLIYIGGGGVVAYVFNILTNYYRSKMVVSKEDEKMKEEMSAKYKSVYKNRFKLNRKLQEKWRKSVLNNKTNDVLCGISQSGEPYYIDFKEVNQHAFVCATTGGGKTVLLLNMVEYALMKNYPFIFIDGKGSLESINDVRSLCHYYNKSMKVFSDISDLTYNPIKYGNSTVITDKLQHLVDTESEYYVMVNKTLVQTMIQFLDEYGFKRDLWHFAEYLDPGKIKEVLNDDNVAIYSDANKNKKQTKGYSSFIDDFEDDDDTPKSSEVYYERSERSKKFYNRFFGRWSESDEGELYLFENASTVRMALYGLVDSDLGHLFEEKDNGLDLLHLSDNKQGLFISLDGNIYDDYIKKIARFIISDINYLVSYRNKNQLKDEPILAIYDEFSVYANEKIVNTINKSRSAGFHCIIATQTLADLDNVNSSLKKQIVGNTNTYMVGQTNNPDEVDDWANNFGTYKDTDVTTVTERQKGRLKRLDLTGDKGTIRNVDKYKIHPNKIRNLRTGEFVFARKASNEVPEPEVVYVRNPLIRR